MRPLFRVLSPGGSAALTILIFHRVTATADPLFPDEVEAQAFDRLCGWIARWFDVLPLDDAVQRLAERRLPSRALAITFDDGYADNHDVALPLLRRHGLVATFFVTTGFLAGGRMWNDTVIEAVRAFRGATLDLRDFVPDIKVPLEITDASSRRAAVDQLLAAIKYLDPQRRAAVVDALAQRVGEPLPHALMMRPAQVAALHGAGMQIGAHTVDHPILRTLSDDQARGQMADSRRCLEQIVAGPVTLFAYPNGRPGQDYSARDVALARECGFAAAFSTVAGAARAASDLWQLPRFTPWRRSRAGFAVQLASNLLAGL